MKDAVAAARAALTKPVEGTIITVAGAAADEAYRLAMRETDFYRLATGVCAPRTTRSNERPSNPALKEAGVVDSGGAGFCYFLEGALRFLPEATVRTTAFPRRPVRSRVFTQNASRRRKSVLHGVRARGRPRSRCIRCAICSNRRANR